MRVRPRAKAAAADSWGLESSCDRPPPRACTAGDRNILQGAGFSQDARPQGAAVLGSLYLLFMLWDQTTVDNQHTEKNSHAMTYQTHMQEQA